MRTVCVGSGTHKKLRVPPEQGEKFIERASDGKSGLGLQMDSTLGGWKLREPSSQSAPHPTPGTCITSASAGTAQRSWAQDTLTPVKNFPPLRPSLARLALVLLIRSLDLFVSGCSSWMLLAQLWTPCLLSSSSSSQGP